MVWRAARASIDPAARRGLRDARRARGYGALRRGPPPPPWMAVGRQWVDRTMHRASPRPLPVRAVCLGVSKVSVRGATFAWVHRWRSAGLAAQ